MPFFQQSSNVAETVDAVFIFIFALSAVFLFFITFLMLYFVFRYSRKRHPKGKDIEGNFWLEAVWTGLPTILFLAMFYYGWTNYGYMRSVPRDAMVIDVTGRQWSWSFTYPNGKRTSDLYLALDKPVKLEVRSIDVIHGFYVPAFRIKEDAVPGRENYVWFVPTRLGSFDIECTVICGISHADMLGKVVVVPVVEFETWYFSDEDASLPGQPKDAASDAAAAGDPALAVLEKNDCLICHSLDGSELLGPSFKGLFGRKEIVESAGGLEQEIVADDAYVIRAIQDPEFETVKGYPPIMPPNPLSDADLKAVIEFIKNLN